MFLADIRDDALREQGPVQVSRFQAGCRIPLRRYRHRDQEDCVGKPFVGPAGALLNQALRAAEIPRDQVYVTNAVKHFKFEPRGTRRIHSKPSAHQVKACRPWLEAEIKVVQPRMIVCAGATAAQSLMGSAFRVTQHRSQFLKTEWAPWLLATIHPSAMLRMPDEELRASACRQFFEDIQLVGRTLRAEIPSAAHHST
jgi:DNA polymerase